MTRNFLKIYLTYPLRLCDYPLKQGRKSLSETEMIERKTTMNDSINPNLPASALATHAHERVSDRYSFISTTSVVSALEADGWRVYSGAQKRVRDKSREGFQTHLLRFVRSDVETVNLKDQFSLIGRFSHDTSSSIQFLAGIIVFACENGIIVSEGEVQKVRFIHRDISLEDVVRAAHAMTLNVSRLADRVQDWRNIILTPAAQNEFANAAAIMRWGNTRVPGSKEVAAPILLSARRWQDDRSDLWSVFNRIQENVVKGQSYYTYNHNRRQRYRQARRQTRAVNGVDQSIDINQTLWALACRLEQGLPLLEYHDGREPTLTH
jgi:hypothetical protein